MAEEMKSAEEMQDIAADAKRMSPEDMANIFQEDWNSWEEAHTPKLTEFETFQDLYDSKSTNFHGMKGDTVVENVGIMETYRIVETVVSGILASIWGQKPWFSTSAPSADELMTRGVAEWERILEHQFRNPFAQFDTKRDIFLRGLVLNGTGVCETNWHVRTRWNDLGDAFAPKELGDGPAIEPINLSDFAFEPSGTDVDQESSAWIDIAKDPLPKFVRNKLIALSEVPGAEVDLKLFEQAIREGGDNKPNEKTEQARRKQGMGEVEYKGRCHTNERWSEYPGGRGKANVEWYFIRVNRKHLVAKVPNPFKYGFRPVLKSTFIPLPNAFYGKGVGHLTNKEQTQINHLYAMLYKKLLQWVFNNYTTDMAGNADMTIILQPGGIVSKADYGNIDPFPMDLQQLPAVLAFIDTMKSDMRTSANAQETAQAQVTDTTATENKQVALDTQKRNMPVIGHIVETFVRPLLMRWIELDEQFLPEQIVIEEQAEGGRYVQKTIPKASLPKAPSVYVNPVGDLEHSPAMLRRLGSFLDSMVQWASVFGEDLKAAGFDPMMWIKLGAKAFHMNPNDVFNEERGQRYVQDMKYAQQMEAKKLELERAKEQRLMQAAIEEQRSFGKPGLPQVKLEGRLDEPASERRRAKAARKGAR